jgi:hypothetical protein
LAQKKRGIDSPELLVGLRSQSAGAKAWFAAVTTRFQGFALGGDAVILMG